MTFGFLEEQFVPEVSRVVTKTGHRLHKARYASTQGGKLSIQTNFAWVAVVEEELYRALKLGRVPLTVGRLAVWELVNRLDNEMAEASLEHVEQATVGWNGGVKGRL